MLFVLNGERIPNTTLYLTEHTAFLQCYKRPPHCSRSKVDAGSGTEEALRRDAVKCQQKCQLRFSKFDLTRERKTDAKGNKKDPHQDIVS